MRAVVLMIGAAMLAACSACGETAAPAAHAPAAPRRAAPAPAKRVARPAPPMRLIESEECPGGVCGIPPVK